jgi:dynein light intermediate chain
MSLESATAAADRLTFDSAATAGFGTATLGTGLRAQGTKGVEEEDPHAPRESLVQYREPEVAPQKAAAASHQTAKKSNQLVDVLNAILPPREYMDEHQRRLQQAVSSAPSSRDQVITLQMKLDERLQERQARENGICPVREELYSQCFDELIRQVTIESPERGLLLMRVRDEVRMTISAYQTLYQSSITFGMRKTLQAEQGNSELIKKIDELEGEKRKFQSLVQDHKGLYESIEKRIAEQKTQEEKKMQEEKDFLKFQAQHLESFLKSAAQ